MPASFIQSTDDVSATESSEANSNYDASEPGDMISLKSENIDNPTTEVLTSADACSADLIVSAEQSISEEKQEAKDASTKNKALSAKKKYYKRKFPKKNKSKPLGSKSPVADTQDENAPLQEDKKIENVEKNENQKPQHSNTKKKSFINNNATNKLYYQDRRMLGNYMYSPDGIPIVVPRNFSGPQLHRYNQIGKPYGNKQFVAFSPKFVPVPYDIPLSTRSNYSFKNNSNRKNYPNHDSSNVINDNMSNYKQKVKYHKPWKYLTPVNVNDVYYGHNPFPKHYNGKKPKDNKKITADQPKVEETDHQNEPVSNETSEPLTHVNEPAQVAETSC